MAATSLFGGMSTGGIITGRESVIEKLRAWPGFDAACKA